VTHTDFTMAELYRGWLQELVQLEHAPDRALVAGLEARARDDYGVELVEVAHEMRALVAVGGIGAKRFEPQLHPRGKDGKFIDKLALVDVFGLHGFQHGQRGHKEVEGQVQDIIPDPNDPENPIIRVKMTDPRWDAKAFGETVDVKPDQITERAPVKGKLPGIPTPTPTPETKPTPTPETAPAQVKATGPMPAIAPLGEGVTPDTIQPLTKPAEWDTLDDSTKLAWTGAQMKSDYTALRGKDTTFDFTGMNPDIAFNLANTYRALTVQDPKTAMRIDFVGGDTALDPGAVAIADPGTHHPGGIGPVIEPIRIRVKPSWFVDQYKWDKNAATNQALVAHGQQPWSIDSLHGDPNITLQHEFSHQRQFRFLQESMTDVGKAWSTVVQDDGFGMMPDSSNWKETQDLRYQIQKMSPTEYGHKRSSEAYAEAWAARMNGDASPELIAALDQWDANMGVPSQLPPDRIGEGEWESFDDLPPEARDGYWAEVGPYLDLPGMREHYPATAAAYDEWAGQQQAATETLPQQPGARVKWMARGVEQKGSVVSTDPATGAVVIKPDDGNAEPPEGVTPKVNSSLNSGYIYDTFTFDSPEQLQPALEKRGSELVPGDQIHTLIHGNTSAADYIVSSNPEHLTTPDGYGYWSVDVYDPAGSTTEDLHWPDTSNGPRVDVIPLSERKLPDWDYLMQRVAERDAGTEPAAMMQVERHFPSYSVTERGKTRYSGLYRRSTAEQLANTPIFMSGQTVTVNGQQARILDGPHPEVRTR